MNFTEEEIDLLRGILRSEIQVQYMIVEPDPDTLRRIQDLYDKVCSFHMSKSLGELL